jgi:hypothetical protein
MLGWYLHQRFQREFILLVAFWHFPGHNFGEIHKLQGTRTGTKGGYIKLSTWLKHPLLETDISWIVIGTHLKVIKPPPVIVAVNQIIPWSIAYSNKHNRKREITAENNSIRFLFKKTKNKLLCHQSGKCVIRICLSTALVWLHILFLV